MEMIMPSAMVDDIREIKEDNPFESMMERFDRAAQKLHLDPDLYAVMRVPNRELKVYIPVRMDSGRIQIFEGFRVQHNFARGPAKGGSAGRREATGRGLLFVINEAIKRFKMTPPETRVVVQGSGNVGGIGAQLLHEAGYKIVAISDIHGGIYNPDGINIPNALAYLRTTRSFEGYEGVEFVNNQELLELECDVLIPAATENQITSQNADKLKCKVLAEGANGPTTAAADQILHEKGIFVIPDILANAGGVTVSYFEWVQDRGGYFWTEETVNNRLEEIMTRSFTDVLALSKQHRVNMRTAAYMLSISRVATVHKLRGIYA